MNEIKETKEIAKVKGKIADLIKPADPSLTNSKENKKRIRIPMRLIMSKIFPFVIRKGTTSFEDKVVVGNKTFHVIVSSWCEKQDAIDFFESKSINAEKRIERDASLEDKIPLPTIDEGLPLYLKLVSMCDEKNRNRKRRRYYVDIPLEELQYDAKGQKNSHASKYEGIIQQLMPLYSTTIKIIVEGKKLITFTKSQQLVKGLRVFEKGKDSTKQYVRVHLNPRFIPYIRARSTSVNKKGGFEND